MPLSKHFIFHWWKWEELSFLGKHSSTNKPFGLSVCRLRFDSSEIRRVCENRNKITSWCSALKELCAPVSPVGRLSLCIPITQWLYALGGLSVVPHPQNNHHVEIQSPLRREPLSQAMETLPHGMGTSVEGTFPLFLCFLPFCLLPWDDAGSLLGFPSLWNFKKISALY